MKICSVSVALVAGALMLAGCAAGPNASTPPSAPKSAELPAKGPDPAPARTSSQDDWQQRADEVARRYKVEQEERSFQANEHYRLAEKYYQAGDLDKAELECREALRLNPDHLGARALMWEVQVLRGEGRATPVTEQLRRAMEENTVRQKQVQLEIDDKFNLGLRHYNAGEYELAEQEFRMVIEYAKWVFPRSVEIDTRRQQAVEMLEKTKMARKQKELDEARLRQKLIEEEQQRQARAKMIEQKKELEILFGQAQKFFEMEQYEKCIDLCDRILWRNPNLTSVYEMKMVAQRLKLMRADDKYLQMYIHEFQKARNTIEWLAALPGDLIEFPDADTWNQIRRRRPPELTQTGEEIQQEDKQIADKLVAMKLRFDFPGTPLPEVIDFLREATGLNFFIDKSVEDPAGKQIQIKVENISVDSLLKYILPPHNLTYFVEGGMVIISSQAAYEARKVKLEIYDVQDLTYRMPDLPGKEIGLTEEGVQLVETPAEAQPQFGGEDLVQLIKDTIDKNSWEQEGRSISFQNGLLITKTTAETHARVRKFLSELRASTGILVNVETRFLFVNDNFLQQVGMDFRDLRADQLGNEFQRMPAAFPFQQLDDINPGFVPAGQAFFTDPDGGGAATATSPGIVGTFGDNIARFMGIRVQNIMINDFLRNKFFQDWLPSVGGMMFQYVLIDDITVEAIVKLVSKTEKGYTLTAPRLTLFNTQRGHIQISNQMAYVRDWNIAGGGVVILPDPIIDIISDGIILDVKPIVSADRKYITVELRPTVATLFPAPPAINFLIINHPQFGPLRIELPLIHMQKLKTTVVIPDNGTLLIGGLTAYMDYHGESGIPVWKNIPILGQLGAEEVRGKGRKQLLVILRCRIIIPTDEEKKKFD